MTDLKFHPIAEHFPMMKVDEIAELAADIKEHGLHDPIVLHDGMILDGRHRYLACRQVGIDPPATTIYEGSDPLAYVVSRNLRRRHLTDSQRAMIASEIATLRHGQRREASTEASAVVTQREAAQMMDVGRATVQRATRIRREAAPAVVEAVKRGEVTINAAVASLDARRREQPFKVPAASSAWSQVAASVKQATPTAVTRPNNNLNLCRFLLCKITDPDDVATLGDLIMVTYSEVLQNAFAAAAKERADELVAQLQAKFTS